jgi:hypothetical protein
MCVNDTDEPMINIAQCNVFFEKVWCNKRNRSKLLGRDVIIMRRFKDVTNDTEKDLHIKFKS